MFVSQFYDKPSEVNEVIHKYVESNIRTLELVHSPKKKPKRKMCILSTLDFNFKTIVQNIKKSIVRNLR